MFITHRIVLTTSYSKQEYGSRINTNKEHGMTEQNEASKHDAMPRLVGELSSRHPSTWILI